MKTKKSWFNGLISFEADIDRKSIADTEREYLSNPFYFWSGVGLFVWMLFATGMKLAGELQWVSWWVVIMPSIAHFVTGMKITGFKVGWSKDD